MAKWLSPRYPVLSPQALPREALGVKLSAMKVQAATTSDIPAIMRVERAEGYARMLVDGLTPPACSRPA
jgi:hypothetical protein